MSRVTAHQVPVGAVRPTVAGGVATRACSPERGHNQYAAGFASTVNAVVYTVAWLSSTPIRVVGRRSGDSRGAERGSVR